MKSSNDWTKEEIQDKLRVDDAWVSRGIQAIYNLQTEEEQLRGFTIYHNGVGFNGIDDELLSSYAEQLNRGKFLSFKQLYWGRKKIFKYAGQLTAIANGKL